MSGFSRVYLLSYFYPRPPRGGRRGRAMVTSLAANFYPRPPRGGRQDRRLQLGKAEQISIHALREEGDLQSPRRQARSERDFYPRPPRGGRPAFAGCFEDAEEFLSTPSARRATRRPQDDRQTAANFYPRPPRGGRRTGRRADRGHQRISIHALREEGDRGGVGVTAMSQRFLSTPSARRATA